MKTNKNKQVEKQLKMGRKVEREHGKTVNTLKKDPTIPNKKVYDMIARDHVEGENNPKYYSKLQKYVESVLRENNILFENNKQNSVDEKYFEKKILEYINDYVNKIDSILKDKKTKKSRNDVSNLMTLKKNVSQTLHKKESIVKKTFQTYNIIVKHNKNIHVLFNDFSKNIEGKSIEEVNELANELSKDLVGEMKSWNFEIGQRDLLGHITQPAKVVLINELEKQNITIPMSHLGIYDDPKITQKVIDARLNPNYPLSILINIVAMQALNNVVSGLDPKIKNLVGKLIYKSITSIGNTEQRMIEYIEKTDIEQRLSSLDFNSLIKGKVLRSLDKPDQLEISPDTTYAKIDPKRQSLIGKLSERDPKLENFEQIKWCREQEVILEKSFKDYILDLPSDMSLFFNEWFRWLSKGTLMVGGVVLLAKVLAMGLRISAKYLDKNVEEKQKILDSVTEQIYSKNQAENIKVISAKLNKGEELTSDELNDMIIAYEQLKDKMVSKLEEKYKSSKKEKFANAMHLASKAIDSKIGLVTSLISGMYLYNELSKKPTYGTEMNFQPKPTGIEVDDMRNKILGLPPKQYA
jgi:hypothetical protein